jgi:hypothetical protein
VKGEGETVDHQADEAEETKPFVLPDEVTELEDQFRIVTAAMRSAKTPPSAISALSLRRQALYSALAEARRRTDLSEVLREVVASGDADAAARAAENAGGSMLDVLLARRQARAKPLRAMPVLEDDNPDEDPSDA